MFATPGCVALPPSVYWTMEGGSDDAAAGSGDGDGAAAAVGLERKPSFCIIS